MYVSVRHDKLGNLKQRKKAQGDIIVAHSHRVLGVRPLAPFDLRLGLNGGGVVGLRGPQCLAGYLGLALVFVWGCAPRGGWGLVCFSGIFY